MFALVYAGLIILVDTVDVQAQGRLLFDEKVGEQHGNGVSLDVRLLRSVYDIQTPAFKQIMNVADASARPAFMWVVPTVWASALLMDDSVNRTVAYRLTVAEVSAVAGTFVLKKIFRRPRPYRTVDGISARVRTGRIRTQEIQDQYAFPSGHATLAFALASSWALSYPEWYVITTAAVWATSVAVSRVWLGVHYPSDILAGAVFGTVIGFSVHILKDQLTPSFLKPGEHEDKLAAPTVHFRFVF